MEQRREGDILIFQAEDDWIGKSIALLTKSNVSHSSILLTPDSMAEMGGNGIAVNRIADAPEGRESYLLRLDPEKDPAPLVAAAQAYVAAGARYDFPDLVILAGLLIYRAVRPTPRWQKITDLILNQACVMLDKLLDKLLHKGEKSPAMVCSQLVYQCYYDCGADYRIVLKDALLQDAAAPDTVCLADLIGELSGDAGCRTTGNTPGEEDIALIKDDEDPEKLARELYEALLETENDSLLLTTELSGTVSRVTEFLDLVEKILESSGVDLPVPALFVAPSDLLEHAVNLKQCGMVTVKRMERVS